MVADWSVECSAEDPVLVVPWPTAAEGSASSPAAAAFVDLREDPYDLDRIPEAEQHPALMQALRALNAPRSAVFTAKCDAWKLDSEELSQLRTELDQDLGNDNQGDQETTAAGFASYIDLIWRDRSTFASFHQSEQLLNRLARLAATINQPSAMLDCVLRPALVDLTGPQEGFAVSLYVKALGPDPDTAHQIWAAALEAVVALLRSKEAAIG